MAKKPDLKAIIAMAKPEKGDDDGDGEKGKREEKLGVGKRLLKAISREDADAIEDILGEYVDQCMADYEDA